MQFIDGVDVFDAVMNNLDNPKEILRILLLAAKELQRIHNSNLIHRDIKFENFMYDTINDKCQLIDVAFLTSLKNKDKYTDNVQMGTDTYLAPELNQKSQAYDYSKETDRYAFGMMLYIAANYIKNSTKDNINIKSTINRFGLTYLRDLNGVPAPTDLSEFISAATDLLAAIENVSQSTPGLFFSDPVSKKLKPTPEICSPVKEKLIEGKPLITSSPSKRLFF